MAEVVAAYHGGFISLCDAGKRACGNAFSFQGDVNAVYGDFVKIVAADGLGGRFAAVVNFPRDNNAIVALRWAGGGRRRGGDAVVI